MAGIFSKRFQVRWSEVNAFGDMSLAGVLRCLVETAWEWGSSNQLGMKESRALGLVWVIHKTQLEMLSALHAGDVFDFRIWLMNWRRVRGSRGFEICRADSGEIIARGTQHVVTLDEDTLRPTSAGSDILQRFLSDQPRQISLPPVIDSSPGSTPLLTTSRTVEWRDLDSLFHVNNAVYASYAEDALAELLADRGWFPTKLRDSHLSLNVHRFDIQYHSPAHFGDQLTTALYAVAPTPVGGTLVLDTKRAGEEQPITRCSLAWSVSSNSPSSSGELPPVLRQDLGEIFNAA